MKPYETQIHGCFALPGFCCRSCEKLMPIVGGPRRAKRVAWWMVQKPRMEVSLEIKKHLETFWNHSCPKHPKTHGTLSCTPAAYRHHRIVLFDVQKTQRFWSPKSNAVKYVFWGARWHAAISTKKGIRPIDGVQVKGTIEMVLCKL